MLPYEGDRSLGLHIRHLFENGIDPVSYTHLRNPWIFLAPLLVFAAGAGIFLYPAVSNFLAARAQTNVIRSYQAAVDESNRQKLEEEWQKAEEYNENLAGDPVHDPFVMGSGYVLPDNYEEVLNLNGDGVMEMCIRDSGYAIYPGKVTDADTFRIGNIGEIYEEDILKLCGIFKSFFDKMR